MKATRHKIYNIIIVDESGSMSDLKSSVVSGFNEIVETISSSQKDYPEQLHYVTLVSFNSDGIKSHLFNETVDNLKKIKDEDYNPNNCTPLFDAIGDTCSKIQELLIGKSNYNVLVTILTDGLENASTRFNLQQIRKMISELEEKNWKFTYIGTTHDVFKASSEMTITESRSFEKTAYAFNSMIQMEKRSRIKYNMNIHEGKDVQKEKYFED